MENNNNNKKRVTFRLLCHESIIGGLIGPNGSIVKNLQRLSNSKIWVQNPPPNSSSENRVINVIGSPFFTQKINIPNVTQVYGKEDVWFDVSAAQEGLFRVFERVVVVAADGELENDAIVCCRLLVGKGQVGAVIGKGGSVVIGIRSETGCKVSALVDDKSACSRLYPDEVIVEIEGELLGVKKALIAVTGRLQVFPPPMTEPTQRHSPGLQPTSSNSFTNSFNNGYKAFNPDFNKRQQEVDFTRPQVVFMILCPSNLVGSLIGRGGSIITDIHRKSGAIINIEPDVDDCSERLIKIHAMENVESQYSQVRNAAVLVFNRIVEFSSETGSDLDANGSQVLARVVVPSNQVGCLLGRGGTIISEMRKATRTGLSLVRGDQVPKCVTANVEILEITGEFVNVRNAISMVVDKLRKHISFLHASNGCSDHDPLKNYNSNYNNVRVPPAPGLRKPVETSNNLNDLSRRRDQFVISKNIDQLSSLPTPASDGNGGYVMNSGRWFPSCNGVEVGRPAIVTKTTMEMVVHNDVIGSVVGENGRNLDQVREISGAKVTLLEPQPGTSNIIIIISGLPEDTRVAESLLHAFILSGSS